MQQQVRETHKVFCELAKSVNRGWYLVFCIFHEEFVPLCVPSD